MDEDFRKTAAEKIAYADLLISLYEQEKWIADGRLKGRLIPKDWETLERDVPVRRKRTKVTAAFDADLVKWFRGMGLGYQARMNAVLRTYMLAIVSKEIEKHGRRDWKGDPV